jgi:hypothetical protein
MTLPVGKTAKELMRESVISAQDEWSRYAAAAMIASGSPKWVNTPVPDHPRVARAWIADSAGLADLMLAESAKRFGGK